MEPARLMLAKAESCPIWSGRRAWKTAEFSASVVLDVSPEDHFELIGVTQAVATLRRKIPNV